ncbi:MAG: magnesium transporter [Planctomycetes bacterium]|nr:magnesium transporter [Planctomycetota bacterium]
MRNPLLAPELRELLRDGKPEELRQFVEELHPNDAAAFLASLEPDEIVQALSAMPAQLEREVFSYLDPDVQDSILLGAGRERVKGLLRAMPSDERYAFLERLDDRVRASVVPLLEQAARLDYLRREQFDKSQVGSFLSTEYCALEPHLTVVEALAELRRQAPSRETIYYLYVVDGEKKLIGFLSLRDLITARDRDTIEKLMKTEPVSIHVAADQEQAARVIREYDLIALPVIDDTGRLVGIVTYDDAADIQEEESTEDIERMAGLSGTSEAESYVEASTIELIRRRVPIIAFLAGFYVLTASVIATHAELLPGTMLVALMPMIMASGGSVGIQSSSLIIRAITIGEIDNRRPGKLLWKELRVSAGIAAILSGIVFIEGLLLGSFDETYVGAVPDLVLACGALGIAMTLHVMSAATIGAAVPIIAKLLRRDPAMVSTPAVTAIADLTGATLFFLALLLLGVLR